MVRNSSRAIITQQQRQKALEFYPIVRMALALLSEGLPKASRDETENNNIQVKHMMDSFEEEKKRKMAKK